MGMMELLVIIANQTYLVPNAQHIVRPMLHAQEMEHAILMANVYALINSKETLAMFARRITMVKIVI